jgi:hypothetical protein
MQTELVASCWRPCLLLLELCQAACWRACLPPPWAAAAARAGLQAPPHLGCTNISAGLLQQLPASWAASWAARPLHQPAWPAGSTSAACALPAARAPAAGAVVRRACRRHRLSTDKGRLPRLRSRALRALSLVSWLESICRLKNRRRKRGEQQEATETSNKNYSLKTQRIRTRFQA